MNKTRGLFPMSASLMHFIIFLLSPLFFSSSVLRSLFICDADVYRATIEERLVETKCFLCELGTAQGHKAKSETFASTCFHNNNFLWIKGGKFFLKRICKNGLMFNSEFYVSKKREEIV